MAAQKQILESIRDIIGGNSADEEILDLTEVVEPAANVKPLDLFKDELKPEVAAKAPQGNDVLSDIDALLFDDAPDEKISEPISLPGSEIELADFIKPELVQKSQPVKEEIPVSIQPEIIQPATTQKNIQGETRMENEEAMISQKSAEQARESLKTLMAAAENISRPRVQTAPFRNGDTVEDLVMDMLKPILKEWMDANLPNLVQNIVEKEIKKLVPKE